MRYWTLKQWIGAIILLAGIIAMTVLFIKQELVFGLLVAIIPFSLLVLMISVNQPYWAMMLLFAENYFIMGIGRYVTISGLGVLTDVLFGFILLSSLLRSVTNRDIEWKAALNGASLLFLIWFIFCLMEIINPTAITAAWASSFRSLTLYPLLTIALASIFFRQFRDMKRILILWSLFTLVAVIKMQMQKTMGFDWAEIRWLHQGDNMKTHILGSGTRYFSIFTDAGNYGSNMGCAGVIFTLCAFFTEKKWLKLLFFATGLIGIYGLFVSGTRGALAVPIAGFILYTFLSKQFKIIMTMVIFLIAVFVFFNYTTIGQGNQYIRRMRSAFNKDEPSLVIRFDNQKRLAQYIKTRPFGEGIGLSGVAAKRFDAERLTTNIPNDSWYVKVWVETGIVGLLLYLGIQLSIIGYGVWLVLSKLKDRTLRGYVSAILCGIFGMMASSYGNAIWGQYPTCILMSLSQAFVFLSPLYDKELEHLTLQHNGSVSLQS